MNGLLCVSCDMWMDACGQTACPRASQSISPTLPQPPLPTVPATGVIVKRAGAGPNEPGSFQLVDHFALPTTEVALPDI